MIGKESLTGGILLAKWAVIYSSVTGNTKQIAEAIAKEAEHVAESCDLFRVQDAPADVSGYEVVFLGYWLRLGAPDPQMLQYLPHVTGTKVCLFQTHGTAPTSEHAITSFARAGYLLGPDCEILGTYGCRGKINPALFKRRTDLGPDDPHSGPDSVKRWQLAATHPDTQDLDDAAYFVQGMAKKLAMKKRFLARKAAQAKTK